MTFDLQSVARNTVFVDNDSSGSGRAQPWVRISRDRQALGQAAAAEIAAELRRVLAVQPVVRVVFAAAPSQLDTLQALRVAPEVDWQRVVAFHMDEYLGLDRAAPQRFGNWLSDALFDHVPLREVHLLEPGRDADAAAAAYSQLLGAAPIDIVCLGIGVNGHLAFNDPPVADFADPVLVKLVELDEVCRQQQVDDQCFPTLEDVPGGALTLTIPALMGGSRLFCMVPGSAKAEAVRATLLDPLGERCPSTVLRTHPACTLYLDEDSADRARGALQSTG